MHTKPQNTSEMRFSHPSRDTLLVQISGNWLLETTPPSIELFENEIKALTTVRTINFDTKNLANWDSSLLIFLSKVFDICAKRNIHIQREGIPQGVQKLLDLASPKRQRKGITGQGEKKAFLIEVADTAGDFIQTTKEMLAFIGEAALAFGKLLCGRANFRRVDLMTVMQESGAQADPHCFADQCAGGLSPAGGGSGGWTSLRTPTTYNKRNKCVHVSLRGDFAVSQDQR